MRPVAGITLVPPEIFQVGIGFTVVDLPPAFFVGFHLSLGVVVVKLGLEKQL